MEKKNNKLIIIIAVCLAIAVVVFALVWFLGGSGEDSNESSTDVSVNTEISETVSETEMSDEVSEEVSEPEESIPEDHTHEYADTWASNETDHWYECSCGDKSDIANHAFGDWTITKAATETETGSKYHICSACSYKETVKIPVLSHTHAFGDWKSNSTSHWKECECGEKSVFSSHTYGAWTTTKEASCTATGTKKHTCTACGYSETATIPKLNHTYGDWKYNETNHWKECKCGAVSEKVTHTYTNVVTDPTETEQGYTTHTCNKCGYSYKDSYTDPVVTSYSEGLEYEVNDDGVTCTITDIGTCKDTRLRIPPVIDGYIVTHIHYLAFSRCYSLTSVTIPDSVTSIGWNAFYECTSLTSITIPDSVTTIGENAFSNCTSITSVTIPGSVTSIGNYAFSQCHSLINVTIGNGVTTIGDSAFSRCYSLTSVTVPDSVTRVKNAAFDFCTNLIFNTYDNGCYLGNDYNPYVVLVEAKNKNITRCTIHPDTKVISAGAFERCESLTAITIPDGVTYIDRSVFYYCTSLTAITIPDSVTTIGYRAFDECASLTSVTIGNSVTKIDEYAFYECTSLTSITIPDSVTSIGWNAFYNCTSLTSVTFKDTSGWYITRTLESSSGLIVDVTAPDTAARYLKSECSSYYWYKK